MQSQSEALSEGISALLTNLMSPVNESRQSAERQMKEERSGQAE